MFPFRPIAPAPQSLDIPPMDIYAAACNPPRRAKRLRSDDSPPYSHSPLLEATSPVSDTQEDDPYDVPQPSLPKRRGRKPGTMSRAARDAQRKINHSLIEKARRTKINDALATLRKLVPPDYKRPSPDDHQQDESDDDQDHHRPKQQKSKASGEKEFKLEILVRTVAYLQDLTDRAKTLERDGCPHCNKSISLDGASVRRTDEGSEVAPSMSAAPTSTSRLPSISTWLPTLTPSQSPSCDLPVTSPSLSARTSAITSVGTNNLTHQLPTPPTSTVFTSSSAVVGVLPALTLPSPRTFLPPPPRALHGPIRPSTGTGSNGSSTSASPNAGIGSGGNDKASPVASPIYTPEDETAASLLLRMSTSSASTTSPNLSTSPQVGLKRMRSASLTPMRLNPPIDFGAGARGRADVAPQPPDVEPGRKDTRSALTPSRLLGLTTRRSEEER
ncbi:hypothetical protein V8B97DRAFT_1976016 [Scleroderma yunnanense]